MTNNDIIYAYIDGSKKAAAGSHIGFYGNKFYSYSTVICEIDRNKKTALFNSRTYTRTTSKHQSKLKYALIGSGYTIENYDGSDAVLWNFGYQGAAPLTISDMKRWAAAS